ncbi:glycosyltransferase family 2 protein, partial [Streptosporangium algeriense]
VAEIGRRRAGGRRVFPCTASLFAPVWVLERAVCSWLALAARFLGGGVPYAGHRMLTAAHPVRRLAERAQSSGSLAARNPVDLCEPSQNGLAEERPQRHRATVARPGSMISPS